MSWATSSSAPLLRQEDLELEREVVLEEIAMVQDTPDDLVFELHGADFWNGHPYGHAILGNPESVRGLDAPALQELHRQRYLNGNLIVAAAGNVHHQEVVERTAHLFAAVQSPEEPNTVPEPSPLETGSVCVTRDSSQTHMVLGSSIPGHSHPDRYPLLILSSAFGGGMSSRLFQRIREALGLAYSVFSFQSFYSRSGISGVYVGTRPEWGDRALEAILEEHRRLAADGLTADELAQTKQQVKGQVMLSLESTGARLFRLAGFAVYDEPFLTLDELLGLIDGITQEDVARVASEYFDADRQFTLRLGP
ncbi:M16 family metallopeptidase [Gemmatimonadota bacterium]